MDVKVLKYFLAVAREENITRAAESLHMTQPLLSRQLKDLENELGKQLLVRGSRKVTLTEEGMILRRRAEEIIAMVEKTRSEIMLSSEDISGDLYIGGGETEGMRLIAKTIKEMRDDYPGIRAHLFSGNAEEVSERLEKGLLDFGLFIEPADMTRYNFLKLPTIDRWGVLMRKDSPLAEKTAIKPKDLLGLPILISAQCMVDNEISGWMGGDYKKLNIFSRYNLLFNASLLVGKKVSAMPYASTGSSRLQLTALFVFVHWNLNWRSAWSWCGRKTRSFPRSPGNSSRG
jgi:DNA-binding transcriptional LysR family regulator